MDSNPSLPGFPGIPDPFTNTLKPRNPQELLVPAAVPVIAHESSHGKDKEPPPEYDDSDDDSEWEYEYSTTETETCYLTLDLSVPDLEINQPSAFTSKGFNQTNNRKWKNPLSEALSHLNDRKMWNPAIQTDDDDDDDNNNDDFRAPQPQDIGQKQPARKRLPDRRGQEPSTVSDSKSKTQEADPLIDPFLAAMREDHFTKLRDESDGDDQENEDEAESDSCILRQHKVQVLALHDTNPVFLYRGRTYVGEWSQVVGTDMVFAKNAEGDRFPVLRNLKDSVDLVAACSARIQATEVEFTPKKESCMVAEAELEVDEEDESAGQTALDRGPGESSSFLAYQETSKSQEPLRKGRQPRFPRVNNEQEALLEEQRRLEEAKHLKWLDQFQTIKRDMGETDTVPLVVLPADNDTKAIIRRDGRGNPKYRKNLFVAVDDTDADGYEDGNGKKD